MNIKLFSSLLLIGLIVIFTVQNAAVVEIQILFWKLAMSRAILIFIVLATGLIIGWLLHGYVRIKRSK